MGKFGKMKKKMFEYKLRRYLSPYENNSSVPIDKFIELLSNFCVKINNDTKFENEIENRLQLLTRNTILNHIKIHKIRDETFTRNDNNDDDDLDFRRIKEMTSEFGDNTTQFHNLVGLKLSLFEYNILQELYKNLLNVNEYFELEILKKRNNNNINGKQSRKFCTKISSLTNF